MHFESPLIEGVLIRRYKRFLADVTLADGRMVTAHTPNTGSMQGCSEPGSRVWLRDSGNPKRKYPLSWELVQPPSAVVVGINTTLSNRLVKEAIEQGRVPSLKGYDTLRTEVPYGVEKSRIDLLLQGEGLADCYVEVKNVTLMEGSTALFPDAVTARGSKHLRELATMVAHHHRAVLFYTVQRSDAMEVRPADGIDPLYGETLRRVVKAGVEVLAYGADPTPQEISLDRPLPVVL